MRLPAAEGEHLASVTRISLRYQGEAAQTVERPEYAGLAADPLFAQGRFPVLNFDAHFIALLLRDQSLCVQSVVIVGQPELVKNRLLFPSVIPVFISLLSAIDFLLISELELPSLLGFIRCG